MIRLDHLLAISFLGVGGLVLIYQQHSEAGVALLGMLAGYAFKNGVNAATNSQHSSSQDQTKTAASIAPSTLSSTDSTDNAFSESLLTLADEGYEVP
jgi:hypothetical protein